MLKAIRIFSVLLLITGVIYPALVTLFGQLLFREQANGSLLVKNGQIIGSKLLAQKFSEPFYFHSRPSATDFQGVASGGSNFSQTNLALRAQTTRLKEMWGENAPPDLLTTSSSGLDPHISIEAALYQLPRVADALRLSPKGFIRLRELIFASAERPTFGILGKARVNVLRLNLLLVEEFSHDRQ